MDFAKFPLASTYVFPQVNATNGGQLLSEYNLRCRESVSTDPRISAYAVINDNYVIGPSYAHSMLDFEVKPTEYSTTSITISPGIAIVNGHFIQSAIPIEIDIIEANLNLTDGELPLKGSLSVGLRAFYSAESTMAGTLVFDENDTYFEGIKIVILPTDEFKLPQDVPDEPDKITAHLKLADLKFIDGTVGTIVQNQSKIQILSADRVGNISDKLGGNYVTKYGLDNSNLYVMRGDGIWCASNDSLMKWDINAIPQKDADHTSRAVFERTSSDIRLLGDAGVQLRIPHKQIDNLTDGDGNPLYIPDLLLNIPKADYATGEAGIVTGEYTKYLKQAVNELNNIKNSINGKQVWFINVLDDINELPPINLSDWYVGDYVLVRVDNTVNPGSDSVQNPSTMYVIIGGYGIINNVAIPNLEDPMIPYGGNLIANKSLIVEGSYNITAFGIEDLYQYEQVPASQPAPTWVANKYYEQVNGWYYVLTTSQPNNWATNYTQYFTREGSEFTHVLYYTREGTTVKHKLWVLEQYSGTSGQDFFRFDYTNNSGTVSYYFIAENNNKSYSQPFYLTGTISLAQESLIGGFRDVPEDAEGGGYVGLDDDGHLRLRDFAWLASGVIAYQLGQDFESPRGVDNATIQENLDEYVNNRIAFPNSSQLLNSSNPYEIVVTLNLTASDTEDTIVLENVDSRFNTSVNLTILGDANENTTIKIVNCEKIKVNNNISGSPNIEIVNSNIYYDPIILESATSISGLKLWTDDANISIDGLEVYTVKTPLVASEIFPYGQSVDPHIYVAPHGVTFDPNGDIVGMSVFFSTNISSQYSPTDSDQHFVYSGEFELSQGTNFTYPRNRITSRIKISGVYTEAHIVEGADSGIITNDTTFSILSPMYSDGVFNKAKILARIDTLFIPSGDTNVVIDADTVLDGWQAGSYQVYEGYINV